MNYCSIFTRILVAATLTSASLAAPINAFAFDAIGTDARLVVETRIRRIEYAHSEASIKEVKFRLCEKIQPGQSVCRPIGGDHWHALNELKDVQLQQLGEVIGLGIGNLFVIASGFGLGGGLVMHVVSKGSWILTGYAGIGGAAAGTVGAKHLIDKAQEHTRVFNFKAQIRDFTSLRGNVLSDIDFAEEDAVIRKMAESLDIILKDRS